MAASAAVERGRAASTRHGQIRSSARSTRPTPITSIPRGPRRGTLADGHDGPREAMLGGLAHPILATRYRTDLAREPHFAEHHEATVDRAGTQRRANRGDDCEIGAGLGDADPADHVRVHVHALQGDPGVAVKYREQHGQPALIDAHGHPPRYPRRVVGECLNLDQQRAVALSHHRHHAPRHIGVPAREKESRTDCEPPAIPSRSWRRGRSRWRPRSGS